MWLFIIFLNKHLFLKGQLEIKKRILKFHKIYSKKPVPVAGNFIEKETQLEVPEFFETFKDTFFNRTPPVLASGIFF